MKANELKVTDLMVGDWLMFNDKPCQVKGLHNDDTVTLTGYRSMYYLIDAEPIPLTPEIIEKNGFERENLITSYNHYIGIDNRVSLNDDFYCMNSRNMWNVHIDSEDYLHHEFKRSQSADVAPYINERYIKLFDNCSSIILLQNEKFN